MVVMLKRLQKAVHPTPRLKTRFLGIRRDFLGTDMGQFALKFDNSLSLHVSDFRDNSTCSPAEHSSPFIAFSVQH